LFICFLAIFSFLSLNSCGLLFHKIRKSVYVDSNPQGAEIYIKDSLVGTTPIDLDLRKYRNEVTIELKKENYVSDKVILGTEENYTQKYLDMIYLGIPYLLSYRIDYDYTTYKFADNFINLRNVDSLKKQNLPIESKIVYPYDDYYNKQVTNFSSEFNNGRFKSYFFIEILPGLFLTTAYFNFTFNNYTEIIDLYKTEKKVIGFGLRSGYAGSYYSSGDEYTKSWGYYILPTISYEYKKDFGITESYNLSIGQSFINDEFRENNINRINDPNNELLPWYIDVKTKSKPISVVLNYIYKDYKRNIMASATIGYLNKYNYIQIGFGYFIY
jgi:hypothetical protein